MKRHFLSLTLALALIVVATTGCMTTTSVSGNTFTFDNHTKIMKGKTTKSEVPGILEGTPTNSGSMGEDRGSYETYEFTVTESPSSMANRIPFMARNEVSWESYKVIVYYTEDGTVRSVEESRGASGSVTKSRAMTKSEMKEDAEKTKSDAKDNADNAGN